MKFSKQAGFVFSVGISQDLNTLTHTDVALPLGFDEKYFMRNILYFLSSSGIIMFYALFTT